MTKRLTSDEAVLRSLLQKAVRRGNEELIYITCALMASLSPKDKDWIRTRTAIITFEECWPQGWQLVFNRKFHSKVAALVKVARSVKAKDATGLGLLAYALWGGDRAVLDGSPSDRDVRIVAQAIDRPEDFWHWIERQDRPEPHHSIMAKAARFKKVGLPRDRAIIQAAAYLAATGEVPETPYSERLAQPFPYWVALDVHTPQGKRVLHDIARDLFIPLAQLEWVSFYFEGLKTNDDLPSAWWQRQCDWHFRKLGLAAAEAHLIWHPVKPQLLEALAEDSHRLHNEIYRWKLENQEKVQQLKQQVELFIQHFDEMQPNQMELF